MSVLKKFENVLKKSEEILKKFEKAERPPKIGWSLYLIFP